MKPFSVIAPLKAILPVLVCAIVIAGCSKKEAPPAAAIAPAEPAAAAAPTAAVVNIVPSTDIKQSFAEVDAAMKARAYDKAVANLLAVQQQKALTEQQAQEARNRMVGLQSSLAAAVASGDPSAKAAAEMLRRSAMVR